MQAILQPISMHDSLSLEEIATNYAMGFAMGRV